MNSRKSDSNNLAIIGASGTGKTTLAVGLYATSTESFTVASAGDETRKYLEIRKTSIEEGFWPAATNESENFDLRLRLHASGRQTDIVFREYMGERMERDPNYIREVIGTPKSSIILFNPGMPGLSKPETRNRMLGNLKVIAQHLKVNGCIAVAFVVTASDRLTSDLAEFREDFEAYASEVTNYLTNLGLDWKRFEVTVSGQLDDQNKPKLARGENNTTHEPFLWLLKRIRDFKRRRCLRVFATVVAAFIGVSGALFGGLVVHSRQVLAKAEKAFANTTNALNIAYDAHDEAKVRTTLEFLTTNSFDKVTAILPSDQTRRNELVKRVNEQSDLWRVRLLKMEFDSNKSKVNTKPLDVQLEWFGGFDTKLITLSPSSKDAIIERDTLTNDWDNSRIELETKCQTAHFRNVVDQERKNLASAKPDAIIEPLRKSKTLIADAVTYALVTNRAELCNSLGLIAARTNAIAKYIDSKIAKPDDDKRPDDTEKLRQRVSKDLKNALTTKEFDVLSKIISERNDVALKAWDAFHFPKRVKELEIALNAAGSNPSCSLTESIAFLTTMMNSYPTIAQVKFFEARNTIEEARRKTIAAYVDSICSSWKVKGNKPPEFNAEKIRANVLTDTAVTEAEYSLFLKDIQDRFDNKKDEWTQIQKEKVENFIRRHLSSHANVVSALNKYMGDREEYLSSPSLSLLDSKMLQVLEERLNSLVDDYYAEFRGKNAVWSVPANRAVRMRQAQECFNELKLLCGAIQNPMLDGTPIATSWCAKFAKLCIERGKIDRSGINGAFLQQFDITAINMKVDFDSIDSDFEKLALGMEITSRYWNEEVKTSMQETLIGNYNTAFLKGEGGAFYKIWDANQNGSKSFYLTPWTDSYVRINWEDNENWAVDPTGSFSGDIWPERFTNGYIEFWGSFNGDTKGRITVRVYGTLTGSDLRTLLNKAKENQP